MYIFSHLRIYIYTYIHIYIYIHIVLPKFYIPNMMCVFCIYKT